MQILINIRDDYFEALKKSYLTRGSRNNGKLMIYSICDAIINGVQIPKNHGRMKDIDAFIAKVNADRKHACYVRSWTADDVLEALDKNYAPTIIEADKVVEDGKIK